MIIYGTKGSHLKSERVSSVKCKNCEQQTEHTISVFGRYAYIYWIPIFPLSKKGVSECNNCKLTLERKEMNEQLRMKLNNVMSNTRTPITHWAGLGIILLIIISAVYSGSQHKKNVVSYIAEPQKGDIIDVKTEQNDYSLLKVDHVTTDSVFVIPNDYAINRKSKLYKIDKSKNYTQAPYGISKERFKQLFDENVFLDIDR